MMTYAAHPVCYFFSCFSNQLFRSQHALSKPWQSRVSKMACIIYRAVRFPSAPDTPGV
ncbi:hypothetical protein C2E23DRAFT_798495 [Lenzites betulinus]|nr:hypothetical protein C2E23DRAFT_798495 [Lenzites betulinus]